MIPPQSVNISLKKVAKINTIAFATYINWKVNGEPVDNVTRSKGFNDSVQEEPLDKTRNLRMRTLRVVGSPDSNGANITCVAYLQSSSSTDFDAAESEPALILVQGDYNR